MNPSENHKPGADYAWKNGVDVMGEDEDAGVQVEEKEVAMDISVSSSNDNVSQKGLIISKEEQEQKVETNQADFEVSVKEVAEEAEDSSSCIKVDPVKALNCHAFRYLILMLQESGSTLSEIISLAEVSRAWSKAVVQALDSQTELFYFQNFNSLKEYYDLLLANSLQVDSFYRVSEGGDVFKKSRKDDDYFSYYVLFP